MSRATEAHFKQTLSCPDCGEEIFEAQYGDITEYTCRGVSKGTCKWTLDWPTPGSRPGVTRNGIKRVKISKLLGELE